MEFEKTQIEGCFVISGSVFCDERGQFNKPFISSEYSKLGLETSFVEEFYSISKVNVVRGIHFQKPPYHHHKLVYCVSGLAFDVVVDLRINSPSYLKEISIELSPANGRAVYVPAGCGHGFCALENETIMIYKVTSEHAPKFDTGVLWSSLGIAWPVADPIVSARDTQFPRIADFPGLTL